MLVLDSIRVEKLRNNNTVSDLVRFFDEGMEKLRA